MLRNMAATTVRWIVRKILGAYYNGREIVIVDRETDLPIYNGRIRNLLERNDGRGVPALYAVCFAQGAGSGLYQVDRRLVPLVDMRFDTDRKCWTWRM